MIPGTFTDSGYRFRKNELDKEDFFISYVDVGVYNYYDIYTYSSDTL